LVDEFPENREFFGKQQGIEGIEGERAEVALFVIPGRGNAASPEPMNTGFPGHAHWAWVP